MRMMNNLSLESLTIFWSDQLMKGTEGGQLPVVQTDTPDLIAVLQRKANKEPYSLSSWEPWVVIEVGVSWHWWKMSYLWILKFSDGESRVFK